MVTPFTSVFSCSPISVGPAISACRTAHRLRHPPSPLERAAEKGSVIIVMATDIPLSDRQLTRVIRRSGVGLARLGSFWGHGSGDIALGFTTANIIRHDEPKSIVEQRLFNENRIDLLFEAMADATQEAVLDAMVAAGPMIGRNGHFRPSLADALTSLRSMETPRS